MNPNSQVGVTQMLRGVVDAQACHPEPIRCHPDPALREKELCHFAQGKLREGSRHSVMVRGRLYLS